MFRQNSISSLISISISKKRFIQSPKLQHQSSEFIHSKTKDPFQI